MMGRGRCVVLTAAFLVFFAALPADDWLGYVANGNARIVTPINLATKKTLPSISVGTIPFGIAITPDSKTIYVVNHGSNTVTPIDRATNSPYTPLSVGPRPTFIAISPSAYPKAYVVNAGNNTITPIDIRTHTTQAPIFVGPSPSCIAIHPNGSKAYVANNGDNTITVIDLETDTVQETFTAGISVFAMAITPDGSTLYVTNKSRNSVTPIDTATHIASQAIPVGTSPAGIAITPDGQKAYVTNSGENTVTPITLATRIPSPPILVGKNPYCLAITPDGQTVYVSNTSDDTITPIDTATDRPESPLSVGGGPVAIAITPDQAPVAFIKQPLPSTAGTPVLFDASSSFSPIGTIERYEWDFGDGQTAILDSPKIEHTYNSEGTFLVTLAITNSSGTSFSSNAFTGQTMSKASSRTALDARYILIQNPSPPKNPTAFTGKIKTYPRSHSKTQWKLTTTWKPSVSPHIDHYEIFRSNRLVATISSETSPTCSLEVELPGSYKKKISSKYFDLLATQFSIQAVTKTGEKSDRQILKIKN